MKPPMPNTVNTGLSADEALEHIGRLTSLLHDALRGLGYDKQIESSLSCLPDARARLHFVAQLAGSAAERVLDNVDAAQAQQEGLQTRAAQLEVMLERDTEGAILRGDVAQFLQQAKAGARQTAALLTDIMIAQNFHDLTGQSVRKVVEVAAGLEAELTRLLLLAPARPQAAAKQLLEGPIAEPHKRDDVASSQEQVDDLLQSLGF